MGFMADKKALIVGVASDRSIASGIAEAFVREGAEVAFTYQNDKLRGRVEKLAERLGQDTSLLFPCDVTSDEEIDAVFAGLAEHWDGLDVLVHSVGFAPREQLAGGFTESITREGYAISHDISAYSLAALAKAALPMMDGRDAAILALTYDAATKVVPNYNVMGLAKASLESCMRFLAADLGPKGIRVNAICPGVIQTDFTNWRFQLEADILDSTAEERQAEMLKTIPMGRLGTTENVADLVAFLVSDQSAYITGQAINITGGQLMEI